MHMLIIRIPVMLVYVVFVYVQRACMCAYVRMRTYSRWHPLSCKLYQLNLHAKNIFSVWRGFLCAYSVHEYIYMKTIQHKRGIMGPYELLNRIYT